MDDTELDLLLAPRRDETVDHLDRALAGLDDLDLDLDLVRLVHWEGFRLVEGRREGTVRSRHHRARARLRNELTG